MINSVQNRLAEDILAGRLAPGTKLKLTDVASAYDTGMSPLREALSSLAGQGLVQQEGQKGFRVAPVSTDDLRDVVDLRMRLETMAFRDSIERGDVAWEATIISSLHMLNRNPRTPDLLVDEVWERLHSDFHLSLIAACGSPRLFAICGNLMKQFDRYRRLSVLARKAHAELRSLEPQVVEAAFQRRTDVACDLLAQHIRDSGTHVIEMFEQAKITGF